MNDSTIPRGYDEHKMFVARDLAELEASCDNRPYRGMQPEDLRLECKNCGHSQMAHHNGHCPK